MIRSESQLHKPSMILVILLAMLAWFPLFDNLAQTQVDAGLKRALASYATARTLNASISVAQGTQTAVQPAGVGVVLAPGEVLDPVNDLVEQFSDLMLIASASFGVQKLLMEMGASWVVSLVLSLVAVGWVAMLWRGQAPPRLLTRGLAVLLLIRFALSVTALVSDGLFQAFMDERYQASQSFIENSEAEIEELTSETPVADDQTLVERMRNWTEGLQFESPVARLQEAADRAIEHILNLIVIFSLQTILMPLLILWLLVGLSKRMLR